ncbi:hypothetical protein CJF32_00004441 [Rutstroemia sp. NJR-2017a WRK4]|nr:hypothetical protein CJF32_00004441 [Rutstroemia sp. NJR-2017a WRK4]
MVQQSTKQSYQKAEFITTIKREYYRGNYTEISGRSGSPFAYQRIGNRKGRPAIFEVFKKVYSIGRGKKGSRGIDWFRLYKKYVVLLLKPWLDKL